MRPQFDKSYVKIIDEDSGLTSSLFVKDFKTDLQSFKSLLEKVKGYTEGEIQIFFQGKILTNKNSLLANGIRHGSSLTIKRTIGLQRPPQSLRESLTMRESIMTSMSKRSEKRSVNVSLNSGFLRVPVNEQDTMRSIRRKVFGRIQLTVNGKVIEGEELDKNLKNSALKNGATLFVGLKKDEFKKEREKVMYESRIEKIEEVKADEGMETGVDRLEVLKSAKEKARSDESFDGLDISEFELSEEEEKEEIVLFVQYCGGEEKMQFNNDISLHEFKRRVEGITKVEKQLIEIQRDLELLKDHSLTLKDYELISGDSLQIYSKKLPKPMTLQEQKAHLESPSAITRIPFKIAGPSSQQHSNKSSQE